MNSYITIENRSSVKITDVVSVTSVTDKEIRLYTESGDLVIKGDGLSAGEYTSGGLFTLCGHIDSLCFTTEKQHLPDNIISRLFK